MVATLFNRLLYLFKNCVAGVTAGFPAHEASAHGAQQFKTILYVVWYFLYKSSIAG